MVTGGDDLVALTLLLVSCPCWVCMFTTEMNHCASQFHGVSLQPPLVAMVESSTSCTSNSSQNITLLIVNSDKRSHTAVLLDKPKKAFNIPRNYIKHSVKLEPNYSFICGAYRWRLIT